ncbi:MAG: bifunctional oligoribonuclease/PAP phosphatase NrnA [Atribacterota bacterium]
MEGTSIVKIAKLIKAHHNFIITSHVNLDGDALGSELALYFILKQLQKKAKIVNQDQVPYIYKFLPGVDEIINSDKLGKDFKLEIERDTVLVVLDSSNLERIGSIPLEIEKINIIVNIDHHPSNTNFGHVNYIDVNSSSVGEIIFQLSKELNCELTEQLAIPLFTAIVTDTGSFRYANTKAETFHTAFLLTKYGANPHLITSYIYNNNELSALKLLGEALLKLEIDKNSRFAWSVVTREMMERACAQEEETEGIIDKILSIKKVQVSVLFKETKEGITKVSFRSKGEFNVDLFSRIFGGGGHPNAAGCQLEGDINTIVKKVITELGKALNNCNAR